jgi:hypothetical protein
MGECAETCGCKIDQLNLWRGRGNTAYRHKSDRIVDTLRTYARLLFHFDSHLRVQVEAPLHNFTLDNVSNGSIDKLLVSARSC